MDRKRTNLLWNLCVLLTAVVVLGTGCRSPESRWRIVKWFDVPDGIPWKQDKEKNKVAKEGTPNRIVATWTDTVLHQPGQPAQRGFGGRVFLYGKESTEPIVCDGQLVVYAFVEDGRDPTDHRPTKRYVFPPEQFKTHRHESPIGVAYDFWLPWDQVGGTPTEVSLMSRFEPLQGGELIVSDQTRHKLPGIDGPPTAIASSAESPSSKPGYGTHDFASRAAQVNYEAPVPAVLSGAPQAVRKSMKTTTITLPSGSRLVGTEQRRSTGSAASAPIGDGVTYLSRGESVRHQLGQPITGSSPATPQVPAEPTVPPADAAIR